jgi:hypothetical protein
MANSILSYTSKDYDSIKTDLLSDISSITDTWTSREDSDPGIVLLKLMSAVGDMLCYNFDRQVLEYYGPTVTQRKNAQKLFELVGYRMHWYRCAKTQVTITSTVPENGNPIGLHTFINDPQRTLELYSSTTSSIPYSLIPTTEEPGVDESGNYIPNIIINPGEVKKLQAIQGSLRSVQFTSDQLRDNCFYVPDSRLDETYMYLSYKTTDTTTGSDKTVFIKKVDNLLTYVTPEDEEVDILFQFSVDDYDFPFIELSSYWKSKLGENTVTFTFYYFRTQGKTGNITNGYLNRLNGIDMRSVYVTNQSNATSIIDSEGNLICEPGKNPQTARDAYIDSLNYIQTYNTLVTIYDFTRFTKRQSGISNALAVDIQYSRDLNNDLLKLCSSYSEKQLMSILGEDSVIDGTTKVKDLSKSELVPLLYNIRKVTYDYRNAPVTTLEAAQSPTQDNYLCYKLNIYPIYEDFDTTIKVSDTEYEQVANIVSEITRPSGQVVRTPYKLYYIEKNSSGDNNIAKYLTKQYRQCRIVNVEPDYTACRVFDWRCCGTLHLTKSVSQTDANTIIKNVISALKERFKPSNVEFGKRITDMEVIETVLSSDSRIRYFDGGMGSIKLIDFANIHYDMSNYFNVKAYFNDESIMRYVQTFDENMNDSPENTYYNYISVDPSYIQGGVIE